MTDKPPMDERDDDELRGLDWAVDALRESPPVTPEWRRQLLASLEDGDPSRTMTPSLAARGRRLVLHPVMALAAGVAFMVLGAAGQWWVSQMGKATQVADGAPAPGSVALSPASGGSRDGNSESTAEQIGVRFAIMAPGAQRVSLVGDFNRWDPAATPLTLSRDGSTWSTMLPMRAGRHTYAFVIDGDVVPDPSAPSAGDDDFGVPNSVILVMRPSSRLP